MSKQLYNNLLTALNKANKSRKLVLAGRAGYESVEEYKKFLEEQVANYETDTVMTESPVDKQPVIHIVDLVDCSWSMKYDSKITNANKGVNDSIQKLKESKEPVEYKYSSFYFSGRKSLYTNYKNEKLDSVTYQHFSPIDQTALYTSIVRVFDELNSFVNAEDKVLINIYTDGDDNDSFSNDRKEAARIIKEYESKGYTVTFVGTKADVNTVINRLNIDESNTAVYDGTGEGLRQSLETTSVARALYSAKVVKGEDVSKGFYKNINK